MTTSPPDSLMVDPMIADALTVRFGARTVVDAVSVRLAPGQVTCVVGPNGAGKSTLLACLAGLRRPDGGAARLGDADILRLPARHRARRIGFLPQTPEVAWAIDAEVLIALGRTPHAGLAGISAADHAAVARAIALTATGPFATRTVDTLSGGERGRVLIARALAGEPEWLLADEPLAGLDPRHQIDVCDLFRTLAHAERRGVVLTLHDLPMAFRVADRVLVMADGRIIADGPPAQALCPAILREAYGIETRLAEGAHGPLLELVGRSGG